MAIGSQRTDRASGTLEPVAPSLVVRVVMRPLTKILNPLVRKLAGRRHFRMAAQVWHTGRRSGRLYMTPAGVRRRDDVFIIPLTFGNQSDWSRNVRAAGGCSIRLDGQNYSATDPEFLGRREAGPLIRAAFSPLERATFTMLGIRQFLRLRVDPVGLPRPDAP